MASATAAPGKYPEQLVIMVDTETKNRIETDAEAHRLSKSEVARTYLAAGIERADELASIELVPGIEAAEHQRRMAGA